MLSMAQGDSTSALVKKAQEGDRQAFDEIVERYQGRLRRQVRARMSRELRSAVEEDDVLQEVFASAYQWIGTFKWRDEESFYRWLGSIGEHLILNLSQKKRPGPLKLAREPSAAGPPCKAEAPGS